MGGHGLGWEVLPVRSGSPTLQVCESPWGGVERAERAEVSQGENLTKWVRESPGTGRHHKLCSDLAGLDMEERPLLRSSHGATRLWWAHRGSELIVVTRQVLSIVGGLAAHKHVPVAQDLGLTQTPVLNGRSEVSRDTQSPVCETHL